MSGDRAPVGEPDGPSRGERCLVTGATGFIGGHLVRALVSEGRSVRCLVRADSDAARLRRVDVELAAGALEDRASLDRAVAGCASVVHCAALVSDWAMVDEIRQVNVEGTANLLAACTQAPVRRLVHISSTDVYGHPGGHEVEESQTPRRFANWYAETKLEAEAVLRRAREDRGPQVVVLRPATVYGPGSVDVIGEIARAIRAGNMLLVDHGRAVAGLCYVENLIDAIVIALDHGAAAGEAFNVSDGLAVTWRELTGALAAGLGCPPVRHSLPYPVAAAIALVLEQGYRALRRASSLTTPPLLSRQAVQVLGREQSFSNRKARTLLGWTPAVSYAAGLERTLAWLRERPAWGP